MAAAPVGAEGSIVVVTPHMQGRPLPLSHPFFLELLASIGEAARARDCDFTVSHTAPRDIDDLLTVMNSSRANGVIFLGQSMLPAGFNQLDRKTVGQGKSESVRVDAGGRRII